jgi:hypothetical protein
MYVIPRRLTLAHSVWQGLLMVVKPEIDDMPDTQRVEIFELRFSRLTRRSDPIVEAMPLIDGFRVGHEIPSHRRRPGREDDFSRPVSRQTAFRIPSC